MENAPSDYWVMDGGFADWRSTANAIAQDVYVLAVKVAQLRDELVEKDRQALELTQKLIEKDLQLGQKDLQLAEKDEELAQKSYTIQNLRASKEVFRQIEELTADANKELRSRIVRLEEKLAKFKDSMKVQLDEFRKDFLGECAEDSMDTETTIDMKQEQ